MLRHILSQPIPERIIRFLPGRTSPTPHRRIHLLSGMAWGTDKYGNLTWVDPWQKNILHDTGEQYILSAVFATTYTNYGSALSALFLGLDDRSSLAESDTLATVAADEPTLGSFGYSRKSLSTAGTGAGGQDFVITQPGAYYLVTSSTQTWTASGGNIGTVRNRFLASDATAVTDGDDDHLICSLALSTTRTINDGDALSSNIVIGMSE